MPNEGYDIGGDFGPYRQSERLHIYKKYADELVEKGFAYYAFDTVEEIDAIKETYSKSSIRFSYGHNTRMNLKNSFSLSKDEVNKRLENGDPYVIRYKMPKNYEIGFKDLVRGSVGFNSNVLDDKVLFKSDGYATYHLANVVDDHLMGITHVIRAEEWLPSTPLHILLYDSFEWDLPVFCHLPLVLGPDKKKLSKRHASKYDFPIFPLDWDYVQDGKPAHAMGMREAGYEPEVLLNFLALLGWSPGNNIEHMSKSEMIDLFDIDRVNKSGAIFDIEKLKSMNAHYIRSSACDLKCREYLNVITEYDYSEMNMNRIVDIARERSVFLKDLYPSVSFFFEKIVLPKDLELKNFYEFSEVMFEFLDHIPRIVWGAEEIKNALMDICETRGIKMGKILPDLRMALTGGISGPDLPTTMDILGMYETSVRIESLLEKTNKVV